MEICHHLRSFGFHLSDDDSIFHDDQLNIPHTTSHYQDYLLNTDFKSIKSKLLPYLTPDMNSSHSRILRGPIILQVSSICNLSQPSKRQHEDSTPRVMQLKLTDGHMTITAIEFEYIPEFSKLYPGIKIQLLDGIRLFCGKILLTSKYCRVLGGRVDHLYSAWITNRHTLNQRKKNRHDGGDDNKSPPKFELQINGKRAPHPTTQLNLSELSISKPSTSQDGGKPHKGQGRGNHHEKPRSSGTMKANNEGSRQPTSKSDDRDHHESTRSARGGRNGGNSRGKNSSEEGERGGRGRGGGDHKDHRPHSAQAKPSSADHSHHRGGGGRRGGGRGRGGRVNGGRENSQRDGPTTSFNLLDAAWPGLS